VRVFNGHKAGVLALAFSPDGKLLASAGEDRRIKIWDLASSNLLKELRGHTESIQSLSWSGDSNLLASGGQDGLIKLWDVNKTSLSSNNTSNQLSASETADGGGAAMNNYSQKSDSFPTNCANIIDLCSSPHNTLMATGLAASTASANIIKTAKNSKKNNNNNN
jgi:transcription initiation factor TFIID subunit 5